LAFLEARSNAASLSIGLTDKQVTIDTERLSITSEDAAKLNPTKYYVDASLGFVLKKPVSGNWLAPELLEGAEECLEARSGLLNQTLKSPESNSQGKIPVHIADPSFWSHAAGGRGDQIHDQQDLACGADR
jgi:hypothetical protein